MTLIKFRIEQSLENIDTSFFTFKLKYSNLHLHLHSIASEIIKLHIDLDLNSEVLYIVSCQNQSDHTSISWYNIQTREVEMIIELEIELDRFEVFTIYQNKIEYIEHI
jgi:hypothetical protein